MGCMFHAAHRINGSEPLQHVQTTCSEYLRGMYAHDCAFLVSLLRVRRAPVNYYVAGFLYSCHAYFRRCVCLCLRVCIRIDKSVVRSLASKSFVDIGVLQSFFLRPPFNCFRGSRSCHVSGSAWILGFKLFLRSAAAACCSVLTLLPPRHVPCSICCRAARSRSSTVPKVAALTFNFAPADYVSRHDRAKITPYRPYCRIEIKPIPRSENYSSRETTAPSIG